MTWRYPSIHIELVSIRHRVLGTKSVSGFTCDISYCVQITAGDKQESEEARQQGSKQTTKQRHKETDVQLVRIRHVAVFTDLWPCAGLLRLRCINRLVTAFGRSALDLSKIFTHCENQRIIRWSRPPRRLYAGSGFETAWHVSRMICSGSWYSTFPHKYVDQPVQHSKGDDQNYWI